MLMLILTWLLKQMLMEIELNLMLAWLLIKIGLMLMLDQRLIQIGLIFPWKTGELLTVK